MKFLSRMAAVARSVGIDSRALYHGVSGASIRSAIREQGLGDLCEAIRRAVPDISRQYSRDFPPGEYERYWEPKMRGLHAFQVQCTMDAMEAVGKDELVIADIGDSAGTHGAYIRALSPAGRIKKFVSVNLDPIAVEKIRASGGDAILCRAEDLDVEGMSADLFLSFQMIEHLSDPLRFFHSLASQGSAEYLLMTVPYRRDSRFAGELLRRDEADMGETFTPEEVHMFELCPEDWQLMTRFAGFSTVFSRIYYQYPRRSPLRLTKGLWAGIDFEGFLALFLKRDLSVAKRYTGW